MLSEYFKESVKQFTAHDKTYSFLSFIKCKPAYWKKLFEAVLIVMQFDISTFFIT